MKSSRVKEACVGLILFSTFGNSVGESSRAERKPLAQLSDQELKYTPTGMRTRIDPATHQYVEYAVDGRITHNRGAATYTLEWTGVDGHRKTLTWVPPNRVAGEVAAAVNYDAKQHLFEYSYEVTSLAGSEQKLQSLYVANGAEVSTGSNPDQTWYSSPFTQYLRKVFRAEGGWTWSQTMEGRTGLNPRETVKGFRLLSVGVPTVAKCYVRGYTEALHSSEDVPEELMDAIDRASWQIPHGPTVGPGLPADQLSPQLIAQNVSQFLEISIKQGWIAEGRDADGLKRLIDQVGRAVSSGNQTEVLGFSDQAVRQLDIAFEHGALLSEARGLIGYNLVTLRDRVSKVGGAAASSKKESGRLD